MLLEADKRLTHRVESLCLFGKLQFSPSLNQNDVKRITSEEWNCSKDFAVSEIGQNLFVFTFKDRHDRDKVFYRAPWTAGGYLLVLSEWSSGKHQSELNFSNAPFWVRVHGLPFDYFSEKNGLTIGRSLGVPVCVDKKMFDEMLVRDMYVRVLVFVDIRKPLTAGFPLERRGLPDIWVDVKYEGLPLFCYNCGRIGHAYRNCRQPTSRVKFGPWLNASPSPVLVSASPSSRAEPNVSSSRGLLALPASQAIVEQPMEVQPSSLGVESVSGSGSDTSVSRRTLWSKLMIGGVESMAILMNSAIIHLCVRNVNAFEEKKWLLVMVAVYLLHLVLKLTCQVRSSSLFNGGYNNRRVSLAECSKSAFFEVLIFAVLFLKQLSC